MRHLPRLAPEFYRGFAVVHWTITLERRATGWLDDLFHLHFRELLLHAAARQGLLCPAYVLMPDHIHLLWMGLRTTRTSGTQCAFSADIWPPNWSGVRRAAGRLNCRSNRTTVSCGNGIACAALLPGLVSTCWTIRAAKDWRPIRGSGRIWGPSCPAIRSCIRWRKSSGHGSGRFTRSTRWRRIAIRRYESPGQFVEVALEVLGFLHGGQDGVDGRLAAGGDAAQDVARVIGGCVGYFSFSGNLDCCIAIRTALLKDGQAHVQAGGGWVNDSTPESEFQETVNKAKAMLKAVAMAENFGK